MCEGGKGVETFGCLGLSAMNGVIALMDGWGYAWRRDKDHHFMRVIGLVFKSLLSSMLHGNIFQCIPFLEQVCSPSFCGVRTFFL